MKKKILISFFILLGIFLVANNIPNISTRERSQIIVWSCTIYVLINYFIQHIKAKNKNDKVKSNDFIYKLRPSDTKKAAIIVIILVTISIFTLSNISDYSENTAIQIIIPFCAVFGTYGCFILKYNFEKKKTSNSEKDENKNI